MSNMLISAGEIYTALATHDVMMANYRYPQVIQGGQMAVNHYVNFFQEKRAEAAARPPQEGSRLRRLPSKIGRAVLGAVNVGYYFGDDVATYVLAHAAAEASPVGAGSEDTVGLIAAGLGTAQAVGLTELNGYVFGDIEPVRKHETPKEVAKSYKDTFIGGAPLNAFQRGWTMGKKIRHSSFYGGTQGVMIRFADFISQHFGEVLNDRRNVAAIGIAFIMHRVATDAFLEDGLTAPGSILAAKTINNDNEQQKAEVLQPVTVPMTQSSLMQSPEIA